MQTAVLRSARKTSAAGRRGPLRVLLAGKDSAAVFVVRVQDSAFRIATCVRVFVALGFICLLGFDQGFGLFAKRFDLCALEAYSPRSLNPRVDFRLRFGQTPSCLVALTLLPLSHRQEQLRKEGLPIAKRRFVWVGGDRLFEVLRCWLVPAGTIVHSAQQIVVN